MPEQCYYQNRTIVGECTMLFTKTGRFCSPSKLNGLIFRFFWLPHMVLNVWINYYYKKLHTEISDKEFHLPERRILNRVYDQLLSGFVKRSLQYLCLTVLPGNGPTYVFNQDFCFIFLVYFHHNCNQHVNLLYNLYVYRQIVSMNGLSVWCISWSLPFTTGMETKK
jgi:hypothetical protein